jgi:SOS-response transcriptional repressor LexA
MEPKIPDGSTVFVQATPALDNGEIGIFVLDGKSYCKQLKKDEETVILHSLNPDAEDVDVPPLSELRTLGRVLGGYDPYTRDIIW